MPTTKYTGAWSYSKLRDFETCRAQFKRRHIEKLPEPESPALVHGSAVHNAIENWFNGWQDAKEKKATENEIMGPMTKDFALLKKRGPVTEQMWAHDKKWEALDDGYKSPGTWIRAKTDAHLIDGKKAYVFDWKTGRPAEVGLDQLKFYGTLTMLRYPDVDDVMLELWYVDHKKIVAGQMARKALAAARKEFQRRATKIYNEATWPEEPGMGCRWCPFRKAVGGPCSF